MAAPTRLTSFRHRQVAIQAVLVVLTLLAWADLIERAYVMPRMTSSLTMGVGLACFLAIWIVMMAAMMLPSSAPMVLMFARVQAATRRSGVPGCLTTLFVGGYLAVWSLVGILAYVAALKAQDLGVAEGWIGAYGPRFGGLLLLAAGIYEITPVKHAFLRRCRSPLAFLLTSWQNGAMGALRMGLSYGLSCLGCCCLLFAILFPLGMMNLALLAGITLLLCAEKSLPHPERVTLGVALLLTAYGVAVLLSPSILPMQPPGMPIS